MELSVVPEILVIKEFKLLIDRNKDNVEKAVKELTAVSFLVMPNSPFLKYENHIKIKKIEEALDIKIDNDIHKAALKYKDLFFDFSSEALVTMKETVKKTLVFFDNLDYTVTNKQGMPIYKPKEINASIKEMPSVLQAIADAEERLKVGLKVTGIKTTKDRTVSRGEIPKEVNREQIG